MIAGYALYNFSDLVGIFLDRRIAEEMGKMYYGTAQFHILECKMNYRIPNRIHKFNRPELFAGRLNLCV